MLFSILVVGDAEASRSVLVLVVVNVIVLLPIKGDLGEMYRVDARNGNCFDFYIRRYGI